MNTLYIHVLFLTISLRLDFLKFILPDNSWGWRADDITDDVSIIPLIKLLGRRNILESEFLWKRQLEKNFKEHFSAQISKVCGPPHERCILVSIKINAVVNNYKRRKIDSKWHHKTVTQLRLVPQRPNCYKMNFIKLSVLVQGVVALREAAYCFSNPLPRGVYCFIKLHVTQAKQFFHSNDNLS